MTETTIPLCVRNAAYALQKFPGAVLQLKTSELQTLNLSFEVCNIGNHFHINEADKFAMKGTLSAVWCAGSQGLIAGSAKMALKVFYGGEGSLA